MNKILITGGSGFIGTNLVEYLLNNGEDILNIDIASPKNTKHIPNWVKCNINDKQAVAKNFKDYDPNFVIHLAARTDSKGKSLDDYETNIKGSSNILEACKEVNSIKRVIITSSQFVHYKTPTPPKDDNDYYPYTIYGESKVMTEKLTKSSDLECVWTIIRPTRVWGPWQPGRLAFYKLLSKGLYIHPSNTKVIRSFGYVGNICFQIARILTLEKDKVNKKVLYVGDSPIDLLDWINGFAKLLKNRKIIFLPKEFVLFLAKFGDALNIINIKFPLTSYRYKSVFTKDNFPMNRTYELLGLPPYSLEDGIWETIEHLKLLHPELFD